MPAPYTTSANAAATQSIAQTNENKVRATAFFVLLSVLLYLATGTILIPVLLALDFGLRAFDQGKYSPFARLGDLVVKGLNLGQKPIFYPPKRFAARIGLGFSISILALQLLGASTFLLSGVLGFFAALESLAGICAGCYVYNWLLPVWQKLSK